VYDAAVMAYSSDLALQDAASIRIRNSFDFAALAQRAIGAPWQQADASDRAVVIDVIARSVVTGIIQRLGKYRVGGLTILEETALRGGDRLVRTSVALGPERIALVDWRLQASHDDPKIVDLIVEGRSMAVTEREKFRRELDASGGSLKALAATLGSRVPLR
jgi:phospholipid transport system substrate-binding protein